MKLNKSQTFSVHSSVVMVFELGSPVAVHLDGDRFGAQWSG